MFWIYHLWIRFLLEVLAIAMAAAITANVGLVPLIFTVLFNFRADDVAVEMIEFRGHTAEVITTGLQRELLKAEKEVLNEQKDFAWTQYQEKQEQALSRS